MLGPITQKLLNTFSSIDTFSGRAGVEEAYQTMVREALALFAFVVIFDVFLLFCPKTLFLMDFRKTFRYVNSLT